MAEVLVRTIQEGVDASPHKAGGKALFSDSYLDIRTAGEMPDQNVYVEDGMLCLLLGHVAGRRPAESLLEEYRRGGASRIAALDGHFLVILYNQAGGKVSVIHDKGGFRHAYYWSRGEDFALSTELSWLVGASISARAPHPRLSRQGLAFYIAFQYLPTPYTMFEDTFQLPPGAELLSCRGRRASIRRHGEFPAPTSGQLADGTIEGHSERIANLLSTSLVDQLDGGGQTGAMLSGGMDTSTNIALLVERLGVRPATFTAGFREARYDEASYARLVADHYGLDHVAVQIEPPMLEALPEIVKLFDNPNADESIFAEYFLGRMVRERGCRRLVTGEGGDEVLGYPRADREDDLDFRNLPNGHGELARFYFEETFLAPREIRTEILAHLEVDPDSPYEYLENLYRGFPEHSAFERLLFGQWRTWLIDGVYMKDSRVAKHFDLAPVLPFMGTQLMAYVADLPLEAKLSGLDEKRFLRIVVANSLPRQILEREKHKFWLPFAEWFRAGSRAYLHDNLLTSSGFVAEHLGSDTLRRLVDEHQAGVANHHRLLWAFLFLEIWYQEWARRWTEKPQASLGLATEKPYDVSTGNQSA
jgi:asparagine synthase (glutamine-hydrolysing)